MASQLTMWKDNDPERYAEDGGGMKRPRRPRTKKAGGKKSRTSSATSRRASKTKPARSSTRSTQKPRAELPKNREYKTKRGARYVLSRVED